MYIELGAGDIKLRVLDQVPGEVRGWSQETLANPEPWHEVVAGRRWLKIKYVAMQNWEQADTDIGVITVIGDVATAGKQDRYTLEQWKVVLIEPLENNVDSAIDEIFLPRRQMEIIEVTLDLLTKRSNRPWTPEEQAMIDDATAKHEVGAALRAAADAKAVAINAALNYADAEKAANA
jgi:hypothetical protein